MSIKIVFKCDTCDYEENRDVFTSDQFKDTSLDLTLSHKNPNVFKLERPTKYLCKDCQKKAVTELKAFLAQSKYYY